MKELQDDLIFHKGLNNTSVHWCKFHGKIFTYFMLFVHTNQVNEMGIIQHAPDIYDVTGSRTINSKRKMKFFSFSINPRRAMKSGLYTFAKGTHFCNWRGRTVFRRKSHLKIKGKNRISVTPCPLR